MVALERNRHGDADTDASLHREFDAGYGSAEGDYFTIWTEDRVYFPHCYDGAESVHSVPRNPCNKATHHE